MVKTVIYMISVIIPCFVMTGINFNNFFKKNHVWEARLFVVIVSLIMGYLLAEFIINFAEASIIK